MWFGDASYGSIVNLLITYMIFMPMHTPSGFNLIAYIYIYGPDVNNRDIVKVHVNFQDMKLAISEIKDFSM